MLKKEIKYEDFEGNTVTDVFYFNISKPELIKMEAEHKGGLGGLIRRIVESKDNAAIIEQFQNLILMAYGQKSEDGTRFVKSDQLREEFSQTNAYNELFMELATNDNAAVLFLQAALPRDMGEEFAKAVKDADTARAESEAKAVKDADMTRAESEAKAVAPVPPSTS